MLRNLNFLSLIVWFLLSLLFQSMEERWLQFFVFQRVRKNMSKKFIIERIVVKPIVALGFIFLLTIQAQASERIGVYKGTFDPPHNGHRDVILAAIESLNLDRIYVVPGVNQRHKPNANSYELRAQMAQLAFSDIPQVVYVEPYHLQILRESSDEGLISQLSVENRESHLFQIMGTDAFERIVELDVPPVPENFSIAVNQREVTETPLVTEYKGRSVVGFEPSGGDRGYSSTAIRNQIASGQVPVELNSDVYQVIERRGLYGLARRCIHLLMP